MTEGSLFQYRPVDQLINSLSTVHKTQLPHDKIFISRDKNVELLSDVTCCAT